MPTGRYIICPYCEAEYIDAEGLTCTRMMLCPECGYKFEVFVKMVAEYITGKDCIVNGEEHDWQPSSKRTFNCSKCDMSKMEESNV